MESLIEQMLEQSSYYSEDDMFNILSKLGAEYPSTYAGALWNAASGAVPKKVDLLNGWTVAKRDNRLREYLLDQPMFLFNFTLKELIKMGVITENGTVRMILDVSRLAVLRDLKYLKGIITNDLEAYEKGEREFEEVKQLANELKIWDWLPREFQRYK